MKDCIRIRAMIEGRPVVFWVHRNWYASYPWKVYA